MSAGERERNSTRDATVAWPSASDLVRPTGSEYLRRVDTRPDRGLQRAPVEPAAQPAVLADRPHACARPNRQLRLVADVYTLGDSERETAGFDVRGIVWSAAGARIPSRRRNGCGDSTEQLGLVTGITSLGDPTAYGFGDLVDRLRRIRVVRSVRVRLATGLVQGAQHELTLLEQPAVIERLTLMARPARPRPSSSPRTKR